MSIFKFDYVPEADLKPRRVILTEGKGHFKVDKVHDVNSKTGERLTTKDGRPKVTMQMTVTDSNGLRGAVYQDLTFQTAFIFKNLADSIGKPHLYKQDGQFDLGQVIGCDGECQIKTKKSPGYDDRSEIQFLAAIEGTHDEHDDIPF